MNEITKNDIEGIIKQNDVLLKNLNKTSKKIWLIITFLFGAIVFTAMAVGFIYLYSKHKNIEQHIYHLVIFAIILFAVIIIILISEQCSKQKRFTKQIELNNKIVKLIYKKLIGKDNSNNDKKNEETISELNKLLKGQIPLIKTSDPNKGTP